MYAGERRSSGRLLLFFAVPACLRFVGFCCCCCVDLMAGLADRCGACLFFCLLVVVACVSAFLPLRVVFLFVLLIALFS